MEKGRCGRVIYREPQGSLSFDWEFGGGDTLVAIHAGDESAWRQQYPWAVARRAEILRHVAREVLRLKAPGCRADIDEPGGWIHLRLGAASPPPLSPMPPPPLAPRRSGGANRSFLEVSAAKGRIVLVAGVVLLVAALAFWVMKKPLSIRVPHGVPVGESVRTPREIATLIQTLEAYVPSLHRKPGKDRYRLSLFLYPVDGGSAGRLFPLAEGLEAQETHWARLLGSDGRTVWFRVKEIGGVNLETGQRIGPQDLRAANPGLAETWDDPRRCSFGRCLQVSLVDRTVVEIDPQTLKASPVSRDRLTAAPQGTPEIQDYLCAGVRPAPTEWLGLHSPEEAAKEYRPRSRLSQANRQVSAKSMRRLYRGQLGPELDRGHREILSLTPHSEDEYFDAAFVRAGPGLGPLELADPAGHLMVFTSASGLAGTLVVARMDPQGNVAWKVDTGIDRFKLGQILPDPRQVTFIGTRPPVANQVPEPILVILDTRTGGVSTSTLWK